MNKTKLEIYSASRYKSFSRELKNLKEAQISKRNKELITDFHNYLFSQGCGELRVAKLSSQLRAICRWLDSALSITKDLDKLKRKELIKLVSFINRLSEKSPATRSDYKRALKQFFKWFKDEDTRLIKGNNEQRQEVLRFYNYLEKDVKRAYKGEQVDPTTIITEEEIQQVIDQGAKTPRDKAFLACLHEWGCRAGEFLGIRVGDIIPKENHVEVHIPCGKSGKRVIYGVTSVPYLLKYLDVHPYKGIKASYLWLSEAQHNRDQPLMHKGGQKLINNCFKRAGVKKKHNWHWFRHSRSTILAPRLTEIMLCKYMGWVLGSQQVRTYVHLCNRQLEDVFLAVHGVKSQAEDKPEPIKCSCGTLNTHKERYCYKCFRPLSVSVALQDEELVKSETNKTVEFLMEIMQNPELLAKFKKFKEEDKK